MSAVSTRICLLPLVDVNEKHLDVIAALQNVLFRAGDFAGGDIYYLRMVFYGLLWRCTEILIGVLYFIIPLFLLGGIFFSFLHQMQMHPKSLDVVGMMILTITIEQFQWPYKISTWLWAQVEAPLKPFEWRHYLYLAYSHAILSQTECFNNFILIT